MGSAINLDEIKRYEVTEVYSHPDAKVDIVLVHGLNGDPRGTWTAEHGTFWPTQLLPVSLKSAQARILVYGYNADVVTFGNTKGPSSDMIHQHAQTLLANLSLERKSEETDENPIVWIAHSLGGILVKRALELSFDLQGKNADDLRSIYVSTYGIMFLGTPHDGSDIARFGVVLERMVHGLVPRRLLQTQGQLVKTLQANNETLQNINLKFLDIYPNRFKVCMVHESHPTDLRGTKALIVDQKSAGPLLPDVQYFGIEATHSGMVKYESKNSPGYSSVSGLIKMWVQEAPKIVMGFWELERVQREQIIRAQADNLLGKYNTPPQRPISSFSSTPNPSVSLDNSRIIDRPETTINISPEESFNGEPHFIKPSGFRPNSLFVGREVELELLHKMLFDEERRTVGTSAVLLQCLPGGGKSHLARQYVYKHKDAFPGGIFWVRAKSQAELVAGYWQIAQKAALKELSKPGTSDPESDPRLFIQAVRTWFNGRRDWLLVLDGIHFSDVDVLQRFIPDSPRTSLIYTSTERAATGDHHFMNPQLIRLPRLTAVEAQNLLLLELGKKPPFSQDDLKYGMELVQAIEFLPVVINHVSQRMKTTDEPLSRFARSYASQPRLRGLGSYIAVVEQIKQIRAEEALNLMNLICFFSQHIPVEMISLGLKAIPEVAVKASEPVTGRSLNNTFKILNTFALIDRNDHELNISSSQSSKGSRDMLADNVDVIRLHSVVQGFFADTLREEGVLPTWLHRATRLFCCAYDRAYDRIMRKTNAGLVEDFLLFEIHGKRLKTHLDKVLSSKHLQKGDLAHLQQANELLDDHLSLITFEIEKRTPQSTQVLIGGKSDIVLTSIFDRTSSSSDSSDTPDRYELDTRVSTWGIDAGQGQHESPSSLFDKDYTRRMEATYKIHFPLPDEEDAGYESDREGEGSVAMTAKPSQRTIKPESASPSRSAEGSKNRRPASRIGSLPLHRTIRTLESSRYRDSAGSYRSLRADDPRISKETIHGMIESGSPPEKARGRISSKSGAIAALAQISKASPPPARGGAMISGRRSPSRGKAGLRMVPGTPSYAVAMPNPSINHTSASTETFTPELRTSSGNSLTPDRTRSSAKEALQRFPLVASPTTPHTPMPPYPLSPFVQTGQDGDTFQTSDRYDRENMTPGTGTFASKLYPRKEGLLPIEHGELTSSNHNLGVTKSGQTSMHISTSNLSDAANLPFLSFSAPNIALRPDNSEAALYYPGRPELSDLTPISGGYSSQPMSRETSGQSKHSLFGINTAKTIRRPSLAETEPEPQLPAFSPRIAPTSYQEYEQLRERDLLRDRNVDLDLLKRESAAGVGQIKRSPQLEYARAALLDKLEDWSVAPDASVVASVNLQPRRKFDPNAPSFSPSHSFTQSPVGSIVPSISMVSSDPSTGAMSTYSQVDSYNTALPIQPYSRFPIYTSLGSTVQVTQPVNNPPALTPLNPSTAFPACSQSSTDPQSATAGATNMERSSSGGVKIGPGKLISFGESEPVDYEIARGRAEVLRKWANSEREAADRTKGAVSPVTISDVETPTFLEEESLDRIGLGIDALSTTGE